MQYFEATCFFELFKKNLLSFELVFVAVVENAALV